MSSLLSESFNRSRLSLLSSSCKEYPNAPNCYLCPIGYTLMKEPVIALDGHSYERNNIVRWFQTGGLRSPLTNQPMDSTLLLPNYTLRSAIHEWLRQQQHHQTDDLNDDLDEEVPTLEELNSLCEEGRAEHMADLAEEIGRMARVNAIEGKRCFEDDNGNPSYLQLQSLSMFKWWMAEDLAKSVFVDASSPLFAPTNSASPLPADRVLPMPVTHRSGVYVKMLEDIFARRGIHCSFHLLNDDFRFPVRQNEQDPRHGLRELPVCVWLSWRMPASRADGSNMNEG